MAYTPISLGEIAQQAGAIKGQAQRSQLADLQIQQGTTDIANQQGIQSTLASNPNASLADFSKYGQQGIQASQQVTQAKTADMMEHYKQTFVTASQIANATDPVAAVQQYAPQFPAQYDKVHGDGAYAKLAQDPAALKAQAQQLAEQTLPALGDPTELLKFHNTMLEKHYEQEGPGGQAARNAATISAENSRNAATIATTKRGQDLEAQARGIPSGYRRAADGKSVEAIPGGPADTSTNWSDEAIQTAGERFRLTGQMPPLGRNGQVIAGKIASAAAASAKANGQDAESAAYSQIASKANIGALAGVTKQQATVGAFEKTAQANMTLAEQELGKLELSGSPIVNKALNAWRQGVSGDPQTARFVNALTTARTEYAKVLSGATGAQGITDSARGEANELFNKSMNPEALRQAFQVARTEMGNRMTAFDAQKAELRGTITGKTAAPAGAGPAPTTAAPAAPAPPQAGALVKGYRFKGGDPADQSNWVKAGG